MSEEIAKGTIVEVSVDKVPSRGVVRFCGSTVFNPVGIWVGIELDEPKGKNDGSVKGVEYFKCAFPRGIFARPSQVKPIAMPPPPPQATPSTRPVNISRTSSTPARPRTSTVTSTVPSRANSPAKVVKATPSASASARAGSPSKSAKPHPPPISTFASPARTRAGGPPSPAKRASVGPTPTLVTRPSGLSRTHAGIAIAESVPLTPLAAKSRPTEPKRGESPVSVSPSNTNRTTSPLPAINFQQNQTPRAPSSLIREIETETEQENQELKAKIRVLEAKRADDARVIEKLESQIQETNHFVAVRPKMQQQIATLQQELSDKRRALADAEQVQADHENRITDVQEQLEMAMLDKEVAEERAEAAELEMEALKERVESLEVELESIREGGVGEDGGEVDPVRTSIAYNQLEKHNDRLKEALIKLRDASRETEQEQRHRIQELERELQGIEELHTQYDSTLVKLANAEDQIDELKQQLDDTLGAEEMLEQLTERNLILGEKIAEMTITIEDLEALKELNDELEENHVETEKQLHEEIEQKEMAIRDQANKIMELEDACQDFEMTISQFRDLVMQLQTDLDALRMQTQTAQSESATAVSQHAAVMSLNLKLQSSAAKNQARQIEHELIKIQARESKELYDIVKPYLPQLYVESDMEATQCYMFFQRMAAKADLINSIVAQSHGLPDALNGDVNESLVRICELRARVSTMSTICKRFMSVMRRCDVELFLNIGRIFAEIAHFEKRIDMHVELLCRDEFRDAECVNDVQKAVNALGHLVEVYADGTDIDLGEREYGLALSFDHELDMISASLGYISTFISDTMKDEDVVVGSDGDPKTELIEPFKRLRDQVKGAKVLSKKLARRLEELIADSSAVKPILVTQLTNLGNKVNELVDFGPNLAQDIFPYLQNLQNNKGELLTSTLLQFVQSKAKALDSDQTGCSPWDIISASIKGLTTEANSILPLVMEAENIKKLTITPPWVARIEDIRSALAVNVEAERRVSQLNEEMQGLARAIRTKDQTIQEANVKIELMERRMDAVKKQAEAISNLESEIAKARKAERSYEEAIEQLQTDLDAREQENSKLKQLTSGIEKQASTGAQPQDQDGLAPVETNLETSHLLELIESLRGAVRFLRRENSYLKGQDLLREIQSLPPIPDFSRPDTPPLDTSDSSSEPDTDWESSRPPTLHSLTTETNVLYRQVINFQSTPKVVDLSVINKKKTGAAHQQLGWIPKKLTPSHQLLERKQAAEVLSRRVRGLLERANALGIS